jgi:hypothetical protein
MSAAAALVAAATLAGCGSTTYFAGRTLPPSGLTNRVLIAIQNPGGASGGGLEIVDAFYDIRYKYNSTNAGPAFLVSYSGKEPISIQNMPEEQLGGVYGAGDGSFNLINYATEKKSSTISNLTSDSSSIFTTKDQQYVFAASQASHVLTVVDNSATNPGSYSLSLPGVYRVSVNAGGSVALVFVQNSNFIYYPRKLTAAQRVSYAGGSTNWPANAVDCEPLNAPGFCLFQVADPNGSPLTFNRPIKAVFSADGSTAYVLSCGPECGGATAPVTGFPATAAVSTLPVAPMIFLIGQQSGLLPTQATLNSTTLSIPGGASNALVDGTTMYVVGQQPVQVKGQTLFTGNLTVVNLATNTVAPPTNTLRTNPIPISDGAPGAVSRMILADDNTLWIGMTQCTNGVRTATGEPYGCLTMVNTSTGTATLLPYIGDATGIAAVTGLHKIYTAEGGQIYIYSTVDGSAIDNTNVMITGTAFDVAYMDALSDSNNTVY